MSQNVPLGKGFLKLILSQYLPAFKGQNEAGWKKGFALFSTPVFGKDNEVKETVRFCFYEYRYYDEDNGDVVIWKMYEARLPGASKSYTKCIVGIGA